MPASSAARSFEDLDEPSLPSRQRVWASNVPYDILDDEAAPPLPSPISNRARRVATAPTQHLYAMPSNRDEVTTYRPQRVAATPPAPARAYEAAYSPARATAPARLPNPRTVLTVGGGLVLVAGLYVAMSMVLNWGHIMLDNMAYGNPRTTHLDAVLGNGDSAAQPTHFIALNLNRQVSILELPGGDVSKAVAITGPYLFGDGEDLTPIQLRVEDINGDNKPDLLVTVKDEQLAYINDKDTFRPITADEKAKIEQATK